LAADRPFGAGTTHQVDISPQRGTTDIFPHFLKWIFPEILKLDIKNRNGFYDPELHI
jgi:hypothetical protein